MRLLGQVNAAGRPLGSMHLGTIVLCEITGPSRGIGEKPGSCCDAVVQCLPCALIISFTSADAGPKRQAMLQWMPS